MATTARMLTEEPILLTGTNARIATLTLKRPRRYNALSEDMLAPMTCNMDSEDAREGIDAFIEKRKPVWTGR